MVILLLYKLLNVFFVCFNVQSSIPMFGSCFPIVIFFIKLPESFSLCVTAKTRASINLYRFLTFPTKSSYKFLLDFNVIFTKSSFGRQWRRAVKQYNDTMYVCMYDNCVGIDMCCSIDVRTVAYPVFKVSVKRFAVILFYRVYTV